MPACRWHSLFCVVVAAGALGCGSDPSGVPARTLEVVVVTSGPEPDPDGYTVQVDGEPSRPISPSQAFQRPDISPGNHSVYISGLAGNCSVVGANPRQVVVEAEGTTTITVEVACRPGVGSVLVSIRTQGPAAYPSTYAVALDGAAAVAVDTGLVLLEALPGEHRVQLAGLAENCTTQGNPRTVSVTKVDVIQVEFLVLCVAQHGVLEITTIPLGYQNPGDFAFRLDGGTLRRLPSGSTQIMTINSGDHTVELLQVPPNCRVLGPNPRPVTLPAAGRARVNFSIQCDPFAPGRLEVSVASTGPATDADGYVVRLNGDPHPVRTEDRLVFEGMMPGNHLLTLDGLAVGCRIDGERTRMVFVPVGGVAAEQYVVTCSDPT